MGDAAQRRRSKGGEGEIQRSSINIMEICNSSVPTPRSEVSLAARISAGEKVLYAYGNGKSAGEKSFSQHIEEAVERQKEKACYTISAIDTFHITSVTSEPNSLRCMSLI